MRPSISLALILLISLTSSIGSSQTTKRKAVQPGARTNVELGTSFRFDGTSLHGRLQSSPTTTATVENDKFLEEILGGRKDFKDRDKQDRERF